MLHCGKPGTELGSHVPGCADTVCGALGKALARARKHWHSRPGSSCHGSTGPQAGTGGGAGSGKQPLPGARHRHTGQWHVCGARILSACPGKPIPSSIPQRGTWRCRQADFDQGGVTLKLQGCRGLCGARGWVSALHWLTHEAPDSGNKALVWAPA